MRRALVPYVLVLLCQILVEVAFAAVYFPSIVVAIGLTFTLYRLGQLRSAQRVFVRSDTPRGRRCSAVNGVLVLGLGFWATNAAFLAFVALPRVVQFS